MAGVLSDRKRTVRARAAQERARRRDIRRIHHRCFWTWPLGHAWERVPHMPTATRECVGCGWRQTFLHDSQGGCWS